MSASCRIRRALGSFTGIPRREEFKRLFRREDDDLMFVPE
jgi:hypothetical protein